MSDADVELPILMGRDGWGSWSTSGFGADPGGAAGVKMPGQTWCCMQCTNRKPRAVKCSDNGTVMNVSSGTPGATVNPKVLLLTVKVL